MKKTKKNPTTSMQDHLIDFTNLPIKETITILRRLGMGLLDELFEGPNEPGKRLKARPQPDLLKFLSKEEIQTLAQSQIWKVIRKRPLQRIPKNMREQLSRALRKMVSKSTAGKMSAHQWQIAANNRIALALGGTAGDALPDDLWPVVAEAAWCDPNFRISMAMIVSEWLCSMRLLVPFQLPMVRMSHRTFWVLIALAKVKPLKIRKWFSKEERAAIRIGRRLQEEAGLQAMTNEWADFWDQWIIYLASQRWPSGFKQLDTRLCKAISALPLLDTPAAPKLCRSKSTLKLPPRSFSEKWCDLIDRIKRLRRPPKDFRRVVLLDLCAPNWENQVPLFFLTTDKHG